MQLSTVSIFENVDIEDIAYTTNKYLKSHTLHRQGDACNSIDVVISGSLVAYSLLQNGSENIVFNFNEGDIFGANLLFGNSNQYPLNIYCTCDCEVVTILKEEISKLLQNHQFAMNFIRNISLNSQGMNKKIAMFAGRSLRENILDYLHALSADQRTDNVVLPITKKQLADYFGVKRPSLFRELKKMQEEHLIAIDNRHIVLLK